MSLRRDWISWLLIALAVACVVVAAFPQWDDWVDPENGDKVSERRHGLWFSPIYQHVHRERAHGGFRTNTGFTGWSWTWLVILLGAVSWEIFRWRRKGFAGLQGQEAGAREIQ